MVRGAQFRAITGIVVGLVLIALSFLIFPIVIEGADSINSTANLSVFTGMTSLNNIGPTLVFVGLLFGGILTVFFGGRSLHKMSLG